MCGVSSRAKHLGWDHEKCDEFSLSSPTASSAFDSCLLDLMMELWRNRTYWQFNNLTNRRNHTPPQQHGISSSYWSSAWSSWRMEFGSRLWRYWIATGCKIWSQYLSGLRWPPMMTSLFFHWGSCHPAPSHCLHQKMFLCQCSNQHSVLHVFSTL